MPKVGRTFVAKGGTEFTWYPDDPKTNVEVTVPDSSLGLGTDTMTWAVEFPGADLDEFIAHILRRGVDETCETLLFPSIQSGGLQVEPAPVNPTPKGAA